MNKAAILRQQMLEKKLGTRAPKLPAAGELKKNLYQDFLEVN